MSTAPEQSPFSTAMDEVLQDTLEDYPGWTSKAERQFNHWYARTLYEGEGALVDLGCMAGSSTRALLDGLGKNDRIPQGDRRVHAYDIFVKYWEARDGEPLEHVPHGESFLPDFKKNLGEAVTQVDIHAGDITELGWSGGAIEYLFIDVMKSWELATSVARDFFPALIPGRSLVVQQDFKHFYTPWIHVLMYRLRDQLPAAYDIPKSESTVFRCVAQPTVEECEAACRWSDLTPQEIDQIFSYSKSAVGPRYHSNVDATKATLFAHLGGSTESDTLIEASVPDPMDRAVRTLLAIHPRWDKNHNVRETWKRVGPYFQEHKSRFLVPSVARRFRELTRRISNKLARSVGGTARTGGS